MRTTKLFAAILVAGLIASACQQDPDYVLPAIRVESDALDFAAGTEQTLTFTATRDWRVLDAPEWVTVTPDKGDGSTETQRVRVSVTPNAGYNRTGEFILTIGLDKARVAVSQPGAKGDVPVGSGTLEDPYTVTGIMDVVKKMASGAESSEAVYIKGKISRIAMSFGDSGTYGNANFYISEDGEYHENKDFYCFQVYYLGGVKWATGNEEIKVGDDVIICGKVTNYNGNTPETTGKGTAYIYELNGVNKGSSGGNEGGGGQGGNQSGDTGVTVYNNNFDKEVAEQKYGIGGSSWPYLDQFEGWKNETGTGVANVTYAFANISARSNSKSDSNYSDYSGSGGNNLLFGAAGNYLSIKNIQVNATNFTLSFGSEKYLNSGDSKFSHSEFHAYVSNDGEKWVELAYTFPGEDKSGRWEIASTTFSIPTGTASLYLYFKADIASAYRLDDVKLAVADAAGTAIDFSKGIALDSGTSSGGNEGGGQGGNDNPPASGDTASGNGTLTSPYNPAGAAAAASALASGAKTESKVYVKGKISSIKFTFSAQYGTATFNISEDGSTNGTQFTCYSILYFNDASWKDGDKQIAVNDEVIVYGLLTNYNGNTPETSSKEACLYSLNGKTE